MKTISARKILAALLCGGLLAAGGAAHADDDWDGRGRGWGHHKHHHHRHFRDYDDHRTVIRERVIVRERERPRHYYAPPVVQNYYYDAPPVRSYSYSRSPAIVVGVDIPPLVIPLR